MPKVENAGSKLVGNNLWLSIANERAHWPSIEGQPLSVHPQYGNSANEAAVQQQQRGVH